MKKFIKINLALVLICIFSEGYCGLYFGISSGVGVASYGKNQSYNPLPNEGVIERQYFGHVNNFSPTISMNLGYRFNPSSRFYIEDEIDIGYSYFGKVKNTYKQFFGGTESNIGYKYTQDSLFVFNKLTIGTKLRNYIYGSSILLGIAFNRSRKYSEYGSTASVNQFNNNTNSDLSYGFELGLYRAELNKEIQINITYDFLYYGHGNLKTSDGAQAISTGNIYSNYLSLGLRF